ncbi:MAG: thiamine pyrophosphate-binding protein [Dehalococcoidia bacterium]|nr:thiamine pyrophosphate-binding protein [Dehalococcoidia bacterium]
MIDQRDLMAVLQEHRGDAVVLPVERANVVWPGISTMPQRDLAESVMGKGSSLGLGVALARPETKVIVLDGDGSLLMNLGALTTIAEMQPANLYHFVLENGIYATTGGQPIPAQGRVSFTGVAREAGYAAVYDFDDLEQLAVGLEEVLQASGPVLVCVKTVPNPRAPEERSQEMARPRRSPSETMADLLREFGRG